MTMTMAMAVAVVVGSGVGVSWFGGVFGDGDAAAVDVVFTTTNILLISPRMNT